jgi:hypothetical protein
MFPSLLPFFPFWLCDGLDLFIMVVPLLHWHLLCKIKFCLHAWLWSAYVISANECYFPIVLSNIQIWCFFKKTFRYDALDTPIAQRLYLLFADWH